MAGLHASLIVLVLCVNHIQAGIFSSSSFPSRSPLKPSSPRTPRRHLQSPSDPCFTPASYVPSFDPMQDAGIQQALREWDQAITAASASLYGSLSVGVVYGQQLVWSKGYGLVDMANPSRGAPTKDTPFRIGSITKVFTTLMMLQLRDAQQLHPDQLLTDFIPSFSIRNPYNDGPGPRLGQLASHMAGLPREIPCNLVYSQGCKETASVLLARIANLSLIFPPGLLPSYSNLGFALLGRAMEGGAAESTWEQHVQTRIVQALGMTNTGNDLQSVANTIAVGYSTTNSTQPLVDLGYASPAGNMYSSVSDLARLMALVFSGSPAEGVQPSPVLQPQTVREWLHPIYTNPDGTGFGHPWELQVAGNYTLYTKGGDINGYASQFSTVLDMKMGVVVLQSSDDSEPLTTALAFFATIVLPAFDAALRAHAVPPALPANPSEYTGIYSYLYPGVGNIQFNITPFVLDSQSVLVALSQPPIVEGVLEYQGLDTFMNTLWHLPTPCFLQEIGHLQQLVFARGAGGAVTSLTVPGICFACVFEKEMDSI